MVSSCTFGKLLNSLGGTTKSFPWQWTVNSVSSTVLAARYPQEILFLRIPEADRRAMPGKRSVFPGDCEGAAKHQCYSDQLCRDVRGHHITSAITHTHERMAHSLRKQDV